ncbi:zinc ribbon domain-containing protein [Staphylococcus sp. NRL 16/872]|uniref:zinc ribbon domain-containing protein n=1 Tax=Staphylococcus sp. NRL 16/872 TaxID=2930131 RepID=UPI001FB4F401|nr:MULTISPECIES: zinc ribbon domain-containing protein [unclassified Staphylococcus]MCJ1655498.1 zinc ribbon domain-containing protein [Staphylococcus sp. NRL 21/187]MCJ1661330.1 zinc ribbon domain-containing protein [Staphylococcus sp. NRL 18/288]MCJ1667219.1 zinc ribbon domain-containing protein [Staphylococcus sp. NRL 19/737]WEN69703.1 zinc ribbon domain-containing protein [Staphylococcus sp. NRL 16/872]
MQCPNCGQPYQPGDLFCGECGTKLPTTTSQSTPSTSESLNLDNNHTHSQKGVSSTTQSTFSSETNKEDKSNNFGQSTHQTEFDRAQYAKSYPSYEQRYAQGEFSNKVKSIFSESKHFFKQAFSSHDATIKGNHSFSYSLLISLIVVGLLILGMFIHLYIVDNFGAYVTGVTSIILRVILGVAFATGFLFIVTFGLIRLTVVQPVLFKKLLSDFVLINTISVFILYLGLFVLFLKMYILSGILVVFSIILLFTSCVYLITKNSVNQTLRLPSFYSIVIFFAVVGLAIHLGGSALIDQFDDLGLAHRLFWKWF